MRHAYLIMAHNNWQVLERLLMLLDDERNDIYLHVDKKAVLPVSQMKVKKSTLFLIDPIDVRWGDFSLIELEYALFKKAYGRAEYAYYHLLSGVDLPLKSQDYIHDFFDTHFPTEFIGFSKVPDFEERVKRIYLLHRFQRVSNKYLNRLLRIIRSAFLKIQKYVGYDRYKSSENLFMGPQWASLTYNAVELILSKEQEVMRLYRQSSCCDEVYKQTIIGNSYLYDRVYDKENDYNSCMRLIDWNRGNPYVFRNEDFEILCSSDRLFARKFDFETDFLVVERLCDFLLNQNVAES